MSKIVEVNAHPIVNINPAFGELILEFMDKDSDIMYKMKMDADYYNYLMEGLYWAGTKASDNPPKLGYQETLNAICIGMQAMRKRYWYLHDKLGGEEARRMRARRTSLKPGFYLVKDESGEGETGETQVLGPFTTNTVIKEIPTILGPISRFFNRFGF